MKPNNEIHYHGVRRPDGSTDVRVTQLGDRRQLPWRLDLANHSPTGLEWGYLGSGPAQLALAILADALPSDARLALALYQQFKSDVVCGLPEDGWTLPLEAVNRWIMLQDWPGQESATLLNADGSKRRVTDISAGLEGDTLAAVLDLSTWTETKLVTSVDKIICPHCSAPTEANPFSKDALQSVAPQWISRLECALCRGAFDLAIVDSQLGKAYQTKARP